MGGASRGWRPPGPAPPSASPSLPPARRRSEAVLPASPSRSPSGGAPSPPPPSSTETPRSPQPRDPSAPGEAARGCRGRGAPSPRPPDRDRAGPAAPVSLRRRSSRSDCWFPRGGSQGLSWSVCPSVRPSESFLPRIWRRKDFVPAPTGAAPSSAGHPRLPDIALGQLASARESGRPPRPPVGGDRCHPPGGFEPLASIKRYLPLVLKAELPCRSREATLALPARSPLPQHLLLSRNRGFLAI